MIQAKTRGMKFLLVVDAMFLLEGCSILSGSRYRLYKLCKEFPGLQVIYSDTDSIFVRTNSNMTEILDLPVC